MEENTETLLSCSVCMQVMCSNLHSCSIPILCVPCGHRFCSRCIFAWTSTHHNMCPLCRIPIKGLITDYLLNDISMEFISASKKEIEYEVQDFKFTRITIPNARTFGITMSAIKEQPGAFVLAVDKEQVAYEAGLRSGDKIIAINMKSFNDVMHLNDMMKNCMRNDQPCDLLIENRVLLNAHVSNTKFAICPKTQHLIVKDTPNNSHLRKNNVVVGCNNTTGQEMIDNIMKHGGSVNNRKHQNYKRKSNVELVVLA